MPPVDAEHRLVRDLPVPALLARRGIVVAASRTAAPLFGVDPTGRELISLLPAGERVLVVRDNGTPVAVCVERGPHADDGEIVVLREIDATAESAARDDRERLSDAAFDSAPIGMAFFNTDGEYVRVNAALCSLLGRAEGELLGRRDQEMTHPDDRARDVEAAWRILGGDAHTWQGEKRFVRPCGEIRWVIANLTFVRDAAGLPLAWLGQFQDITAKTQLEEQLRRLAEHDALTGLANRRRLEEELGRALRSVARGRHGLALLLIDLDGFKEVNDRHGHLAGDATLVAIARALAARTQGEDLLARLGGDEFALVVRGGCPAAAERVARDVRGTVRRAADELSVAPRGLTASIGVATVPAGTEMSVSAAIAAADEAMYEAKRAEAARRLG